MSIMQEAYEDFYGIEPPALSSEAKKENYENFLNMIIEKGKYYYASPRENNEETSKAILDRIKDIPTDNVSDSLKEVLSVLIIDNIFGITAEEQLTLIDKSVKIKDALNSIWGGDPYSEGNFTRTYRYLELLVNYDSPFRVIYQVDSNKDNIDFILTILYILKNEENLRESSLKLEEIKNNSELLINMFNDASEIESIRVVKADSITDLYKKLPKFLKKEMLNLTVSDFLDYKELEYTRVNFENFLKKSQTDELIKISNITNIISEVLANALKRNPNDSLIFTTRSSESNTVLYFPVRVMESDSVNFYKMFLKIKDAEINTFDLIAFIHGITNPNALARSGKINSNNKFILEMLDKHDGTSVVKFISDIVYNYDGVLPTAQEYYRFFSAKDYDQEELMDPSWVFAMIGNEDKNMHRGFSRELISVRNYRKYITPDKEI